MRRFRPGRDYQPTVLALTLLYVVAIVALTRLPETKGRSLAPEIILRDTTL